MSFQFQLNREVKFNHDKSLLDKAKENTPKTINREIHFKSLGKLVEDNTKLENTTIEPCSDLLEEQQYNKDDTFILDFRNHYVGHFSIAINSVGSPMDSPLYIRLRFAEIAAELSHESEEYDGWLAKGWIQEEFVHLDELPTVLSLPRRYAFRYVEIKILDTSPKWSATFSDAKLKTALSVDENNLELPEINDLELEKIYHVAIKTLADCMSDVFEDGPKRDRRLWLGDLRLQALSNYKSFKQNDLVKRCLYLFAGMASSDGRISANVFTKPKVNPDDTFLFDYSLFFISVLHDFIKNDGESNILEELYPIAKKQMDYSLKFVGENGQIECSDDYPVFIDWSNEFSKDVCAQAVIIYTLKQFIYLANKLGQETQNYQSILDKLETYSKNVLFNSEKNMFQCQNGEFNIASQVWMVLAKVFTKEINNSIMDTAYDNFFPITGIATPYMYHHITEALFISGHYERAIALLKSYWGKMIDLGADTFWEAFDPDQPDYSPYGSPIISSYCHAWSCTPIYLINKYVLESEE